MRFRLLPSDDKFFDLFNAAATNVAQCSRRLRELLEQPGPGGSATIDAVIACEQRGDELTRDVLRRLNTSFVTPFDREDIHELVSRLDDVVDGIQSVAEAFVIYGVAKPTAEAGRLAAILDAQAGELSAALRKLDGLKDLEGHLAAVHQLEKEADGISRAAVARLFRDEMPVIEVIKWRDLYNDLENAIDAAEDAAEAMERMYHKAN